MSLFEILFAVTLLLSHYLCTYTVLVTTLNSGMAKKALICTSHGKHMISHSLCTMYSSHTIYG